MSARFRVIIRVAAPSRLMR